LKTRFGGRGRDTPVVRLIGARQTDQATRARALAEKTGAESFTLGGR